MYTEMTGLRLYFYLQEEKLCNHIVVVLSACSLMAQPSLVRLPRGLFFILEHMGNDRTYSPNWTNCQQQDGNDLGYHHNN